MKAIHSTADIAIPSDPLDQIIGQEEAIKIATIAARQRRHLLLVGPPGTGKSLLAQAISFHLPKPTQEISVLHNPETPERPLVEVKSAEDFVREKKLAQQMQGKVVPPLEVPSFVAERLGFRCRRCGKMSKASEASCPSCGLGKMSANPNAFGANSVNEFLQGPLLQARVHTTRLLDDGREEVIVYERKGEHVCVLDQKSLEKMDELKKKKPRKVLVPLARKNFVIATGSSETELLGDVRHDPYGGHVSVGTQPYLRVVPGALHEAHEGVLFVDELSTLGYVQRFLLTAMQEKKYAISGRNPQSAGASVRCDEVPCDFVLVTASNINDLQGILPPLRSRIIGNGYEVLLDTTMPDTTQNRFKLSQFVAQEITKDGKIPHATTEALEAVIDEAARRAREGEETENALTLRLRELSGVIRLAGDLAVSQKAGLIEESHVKAALHRGRNIEEQLKDRYGSVWKAGSKEFHSLQSSKRTGVDLRDVS